LLASPDLPAGKNLLQPAHLTESPAFQRPSGLGTVPLTDENLTRKYEELKKSYDGLLQERNKLQAEIKEHLMKEIEIHNLDKDKLQDMYEWQQPDSGTYSKFQIIHLLITAIFALFVGGYLAQQVPSSGFGGGVTALNS